MKTNTSLIEEKNFNDTANKFIGYFTSCGFKIITNDVNLRLVRMEHKDGRDVSLVTNHSGLDFVIHGYNFGI